MPSNFPDCGEENPLWKSKRLYAAKLVLRCKQHILLFAKMRIHFALKGHLFVPNPSGWKSTLCRAIQVRWSTLKNRHEHPVIFHAAKLKRMINTLYINMYRQSRTEATTHRKDDAGMKKKGFLCLRICVIAWLKSWFFSVMRKHESLKNQVCKRD